MADISKITTLDGTTYDIKDSVARNRQMVEMKLDTSTILPGYMSNVIDDLAYIKGSEKSITVVKMMPVAKGETYRVSVTYGTTIAAGTYRNWAVIDTSSYLRQLLTHTPVAGETVTTEFISEIDGYLWPTIDPYYTNITAVGPDIRSRLVEVEFESDSVRSAVHPSSLTDMIFKYEMDELAALHEPNASNKRIVSLHRNRIKVYPFSATQSGTTYYSFLISKNPRFIGGNATSITNNLTADDFTSIEIPDNYDLYFTRSLAATTQSTLSNRQAGGFLIATRDPNTGTITRYEKAGSVIPQGGIKAFEMVDNVTELLPAIRTNKNIAVVFESRHPVTEQEWTLSLDIAYRGLSYDAYTGEAPENNGVASKAYFVGDSILMHDHLYEVTDFIASGGDITVGTNVELIPVGNRLAEAGEFAPNMGFGLMKKLRTYPDGGVTADGRRWVVKKNSIHSYRISGNSTTYYQINLTGSELKARSGSKGSFDVYDTDFVPSSLIAPISPNGDLKNNMHYFLRKVNRTTPSVSDAGNIYVFTKDSSGNVTRLSLGISHYNRPNYLIDLTALVGDATSFAIYSTRTTSQANTNHSYWLDIVLLPTSTDLATVESKSESSRSYSVGEYLMKDNVLCRVTASIAAGATITVGTNVVQTTVADELYSLKQALLAI